MSKENFHTKQLESNDENCFGAKQKWNYPEQPINMQQSQTLRCSSPADEIDGLGEDDVRNYSTHNVEVQTEKSTLFHLKQDKKIDNPKKNFIHNTCNRDMQDNRRIFIPPNYGHDKIAERLANVNNPQVYDDYSETDSDQPMNYACDENNVEEEKKRSQFFINKTDFSCPEKIIEKDKIEANKVKGAYSKESKSRSFLEKLIFFKDRDKKRSVDHATEPHTDAQKFLKPIDTYAQHPPQSPVEPSDKDAQLKHEFSQSQQTPLMFSRCSSLSSLSGFEQHSIHDDRSSIVSDFSRRTSGAVSPSELPDSPAQSAPPSGIRTQPKLPVGPVAMKKSLFPHQDKPKICQYPVVANDNSSFQNEGYYRKPAMVKDSVFEDDITPFKDESTPVLHSMAASSLSSLTIDDDEDYDFINKCIISKDKQKISEEDTDDSSRKEPTGESNTPEEPSTKPEVLPNITKVREENFALELAPYEEQLLDQYVRTGIAKLTKQNVDEIKPFSWDVGSICRSTRVMLTNTILEESETDTQNESISNENKTSTPKKSEQNSYKETKKQNGVNYSSKSSEPAELASNSNEVNDSYYGNNCSTYEEHLLDQCIRRGISKKTKRNINTIMPFSWDINQICLTTKAMMLRNRGDINFKGH